MLYELSGLRLAEFVAQVSQHLDQVPRVYRAVVILVKNPVCSVQKDLKTSILASSKKALRCSVSYDENYVAFFSSY